jgi:hypothetical protein
MQDLTPTGSGYAAVRALSTAGDDAPLLAF